MRTLLSGALLLAAISSVGETQVARINGIDLAYTIRGSGEPLVLLHGFGGCGAFWDPFVAGLERDHRLIIVDQRGHGRSTNPSNTFTHKQSAADILGLLDHLGVKRAKAIGASSGAMTLLHLSTTDTSRLSAMILVSGTASFPEPARAIMRSVSSLEAFPPDVAAGMRACATRGETQARELAAQFHGFKDSYDDMAFTAAALGRIRARTLIVQGDRDPFFPVELSVEMYRAIPGSSLWIIPDGDHVPLYGPFEAEFLENARRFLRGATNP